MISLYDSVTYNHIPSEMKTPEYEAFCYAVDNQVKKAFIRTRRAHIWANLEDVADEHLDLLAVECRVLFYNSDLAPEIKRKLILNSMYWYMKLGTSQAMREMIDIVFENYNTTVEEWHTYGGEPFHFMVAVDSNVTQISISEFLRYLNTVKNARSRFDYLILQNSAVIRLTTYSDFYNFVYTFCGGMECGTYPDTDTALQVAETTISFTPDGSTGSAAYDESGTLLDIAIGFEIEESTVAMSGGADQLGTVYPGNEAESGTYPAPSTGFTSAESGVEAEAGSSESDLYYNPASENDFAGDE